MTFYSLIIHFVAMFSSLQHKEKINLTEFLVGMMGNPLPRSPITAAFQQIKQQRAPLILWPL